MHPYIYHIQNTLSTIKAFLICSLPKLHMQLMISIRVNFLSPQRLCQIHSANSPLFHLDISWQQIFCGLNKSHREWELPTQGTFLRNPALPSVLYYYSLMKFGLANWRVTVSGNIWMLMYENEEIVASCQRKLFWSRMKYNGIIMPLSIPLKLEKKRKCQRLTRKIRPGLIIPQEKDNQHLSRPQAKYTWHLRSHMFPLFSCINF